MSPDPVLHLVAGPNGAGKTTLVQRVIQPSTHLPFVNADGIAADRWPGAEAEHAYDASQAAAAERDRLIAERASFITETVFNHHSKLELLGAVSDAGYHVVLHVVVIPEDTTVGRVAHRVRRGGHTVPETKVRQRYHLLWPLVAQAHDLADRTLVYDNSVARIPLRLIATYEHGQLIGDAHWPTWAPATLTGPTSPGGRGPRQR